MSIGKQLLEELRRDEKLRRELSDELIPEALRRRDLRKAILIAVSREMATKEDIESLRKATKEDINMLKEATKEDIESLRKATSEGIEALRKGLISYIDARVNDLRDGLNTRISDLYGVVRASLIAIVVTLASTVLTPLILKLIGVL